MTRPALNITGETPEHHIMVALDEATDNLAAARDHYAATITAAHDAGMSLRTIAAITNVSHQTVANIISKHRAGNP